METTTPPIGDTIQLRARITSDEYRELRVISARTATPVAELVAAALRVAYPLTPKEGQS